MAAQATGLAATDPRTALSLAVEAMVRGAGDSVDARTALVDASRVLADDILIAVARRKPDSERSLRQTTRRLHDGLVRDLGRGILAAVAEGCLAPEMEKSEGRRPPGRHVKGLQSLLSSFVDAVARRNSIAAQRIVRSSELSVS